MVAFVALTLLMRPSAAFAATSVATTATGIRVGLQVLGLPVNLSVAPLASWSAGQPTDDNSVVNANIPSVLTGGAVTAIAAAATDGGKGTGGVAGLNLLAGTITADALLASCQMTASDITTTVTTTNLVALGLPVNAGANADISLPGILSGKVNYRDAVWNTSTGNLKYTVRVLNLSLLKATAPAVSGDIVIGEATCEGTVKLGTVTAAGTSLAPGQSGTPTVTVSNTGDVAAPGTTITIPKPSATYYTLGTPTVTGGGTCDTTTSPTNIVCSGITVPGGGNAKVSLPVTLKSSAPDNAPAWLPAAGTVSAQSIPIAADPAEKMTITGGGSALVATVARTTTGGTITVNPTSLAAGKSGAATIKVANAGPSDATTTITIPTSGTIPAGVQVTSATVGGNACTVGTGSVVCSGVSIPAGSDVTVTLNVTAANSASPGATWDLTNVSAALNGKTVTGYGRLLTVTDPDVNIDAGVSITPAAAAPGGSKVNATVKIANVGALPATGTNVTFPAAPAGYTFDTANASAGGGTCAVTGGVLRCTGVTVPAMSGGTAGATTVTVPVTLSPSTTANWTGTVTAAATGSTGTATGTLVTAVPRYNLSVAANGPAARTVSPGQATTMTIAVSNQGPSTAVSAPIVVVAPLNTTFGLLTGAVAGACQTLTPTTMRCTVSQSPADPALSLDLPLVVSANADASAPLTGGCVSFDNDSSCGGAADTALPDITLRQSLSARLTALAVPATITPGSSGTGRVTLTSTQAETGLTVTVPRSALPTGFTVGGATVDGGTCDTSGSSIVCSGVSLTANTPKSVQIAVQVAATATASQNWTATGITVAAGNEQISTNGTLATTSAPSYTLTAAVSVPAAGTVLPGGTANVPVTVTNAGPSIASPATFTVTAPSGTTFGPLDAATSGMCAVNGANTVLTCSTGLAVNASTPQLTVPLVVAPNADPDKAISGSCIDLDGFPGCGSGDVTIPATILKVPAAAQVGFASDPVTVTPGDTAQAKLRVSATRATLSAPTTVTIPLSPLPAGLSVPTVTVTGGASCPIIATIATCTIPSIAAGTPQEISLQVNATAGAAAATWTAQGISAVIPAGTVTAPDQVLARIGAPRNVVTATVAVPNTPILPGGTGSLTVAVNNTGPSDATGASFTVIAPNGATFGPPTPNSTTASACVIASDGRRTTCVFDQTVAAPPTAFPFNVQISSNVQAGTGLTGGCIDLDNNGVCTSADTAMPSIPIAVPLQARLTVTTTPSTLTPGAAGTSTSKITLRSTADIADLVVVNSVAVPAGVTVVGVTDPNGNACAVQAGGTFTCNDVDLSGSAHSGDITLTLRAVSGANPATWTAGLQATESGGQTAQATGTVAVIGAAQTALTVTATGPSAGSLNPGSTTSVTLTVANAGPSDAANSVLAVTAPTGTAFGTPLPAGCQTVTATRLNCQVSVLANGTAGLVLPVVIPANADLFATITGGGVDVDGDGAFDATMPSIVLRQPVDRRAAVSVTPATVTPGTTANVVVRVTAENGALNNFTLAVPAALQNADLQLGTVTPGACTKTGTTVSCTWANIAKGSYQDVTIPVQADSDAAAGLQVTTTGITMADVTGTATLAARQLAVTTAPQSTVNPTYGAVTAIEPGATGTIPIVLTNAGPSDAAGTQVGIIAPAGTTFGTPLPASCTADTPGTTLTCTVSIAKGAAANRAVPVTVDANADPANPVTGGCVDIDNSGTCTTPPDTALPTIPLTTRFDQEVTVHGDRATLPTGGGTATANLIVSSTKIQPADVTIPLTGLPSGWSVTTNTAGCSATLAAVTCTGLGLVAGDKTIALDVTASAGAVQGDNWDPTGITVTGHGNQTITTSSLLALVGSVPYALAAVVTGVPANGTTLPGDTVPLTVTVTNNGSSSPTLRAPVQVTAPTGTTFGTPVPADCTRTTATTLDCRTGVTTTGQVASWSIPILVPGNAAGGYTVQDGCIDLDATGTCDVPIDPFTVRAPLAAVISAGSTTPATPAPGGTGTATVTLTAVAARSGLGVTVELAGLPTGVAVTGVTLGGNACTIAGTTATCPAATFAANGTSALTVAFTTGPNTAPGSIWSPAITVTDPNYDSVVLRPRVLTVDATASQIDVSLDLPAAGTVLPGGTADIEVTMANSGVSDEPAGRVLITAPTGTTFDLTGTTAASLCNADSATQITCITSLAAGANKKFRLLMNVAGTVPAGSTLTGGCVDQPGGSACDTALTFTLGKPFADQAQLSFTRADVVPGAIGTAYVKVTTDRALTGLEVTVPLAGLPTGVDIAGASGPVNSSCTVNSTEITCSGVALTSAAGQNLVTIRVHPASNLVAGVAWSPVATLGNGAGDTSQGSGTLLRTLAPVPNVQFTMSAPTGTVAPGGEAVITGTLDNQGFSDLTNATVRVKAPTGTTFGTPLPTGCTAVGNTLLNCTVTVPAGAAAPVTWSLPIEIPANADPNTPVSGGCVDLDRDNVCEPGEPALPDITLTATLDQALTLRTPSGGGANLTPGVTGTVTVTVASTQARSGMTVSVPTDTLPTGMQVVQARTDSGSCSVGQRAVTCTGVSVSSGGTTDIVLTTLVAGAAPTGTWSPTVTVSQGSRATEQPVTGAATIGAPQIDVKVTVGVPGSQTVLPGGAGSITITTTNTGPSQASGLTYSAIAPAGTSFPALTGAAASSCTRVSASRVDCQMSVAGNGRSQVILPFVVDANANPATPVTGGCVRATAGSTCSVSDAAIPSITLATPLSGKLQLTGVVATVVPGRTGSGVLRITATGAVTGATVTIPLAGKPAGFTVTGATGPSGSACSVGGTAITCTGVNLTTGANTAVTVVTSTPASAAAGTTWRATGVTVTAGGETATGLADLVTTGDPVAAISFRTVNASATVKPGATTSLTITATNAGPSNATRRTATVIAPDNTQFGALAGIAAQDCTVTSASVLTCTYDLAVSDSKSYVVPLVVSSGVKDGDKLTGGCVSADGNRTCGSDLDVTVDQTPSETTISKTGTLSLDSTVVAAGGSGSAVVRLSSTVAHTGLVLTVPLSGRPDGFSAKSAAVDGATCTVGDTTIRCTGIGLVAGQAKVLTLGIDVDASAAATAAWWATGITLADPAVATDKLTASGLLVSTSKMDYAVSVTVGSPTVAAPLPGQTAALPITLTNAGPGDASPYVATIRLPENTTAGTLPNGCVAGSTAWTVVCSVTLPAGSTKQIPIPLVVSIDLKGGETLTGGCVDEALSATPDPDGACGGDADVAFPEISLGRYKVNLAVTYDKPAVALGPNSTAVVVRIPYTNEGTDTANNVTFTVVPPAGVVVRSAAIQLDDSTVTEGLRSAATAETVAATCAPAGGDAASNAVVCTAPDAAGLYASQLLLTVDGSNSTKSGTQPMQVTISTTSAEGNMADNTVSVMLKLTAKASSGGDTGGGDDGDHGNGDGGGGDMPKTGQNILGVVALSVLMMVAGLALLSMMGRTVPVAGAVRTPVRLPGIARHERTTVRLPRVIAQVRRPWRRRRR